MPQRRDSVGTVCNSVMGVFFLTGPVETARQQRTTFFFLFFLFFQGTSIGLVPTNHALLSLVDTNRVQYTFV